MEGFSNLGDVRSDTKLLTTADGARREPGVGELGPRCVTLNTHLPLSDLSFSISPVRSGTGCPFWHLPPTTACEHGLYVCRNSHLTEAEAAISITASQLVTMCNRRDELCGPGVTGCSAAQRVQPRPHRHPCQACRAPRVGHPYLPQAPGPGRCLLCPPLSSRVGVWGRGAQAAALTAPLGRADSEERVFGQRKEEGGILERCQSRKTVPGTRPKGFATETGPLAKFSLSATQHRPQERTQVCTRLGFRVLSPQTAGMLPAPGCCDDFS